MSRALFDPNVALSLGDNATMRCVVPKPGNRFAIDGDEGGASCNLVRSSADANARSTDDRNRNAVNFDEGLRLDDRPADMRHWTGLHFGAGVKVAEQGNRFTTHLGPFPRPGSTPRPMHGYHGPPAGSRYR